MNQPIPRRPRNTGVQDQEELLRYMNREGLPLLKQIHSAVNFSTRAITANYEARPEDGLLLVDATDGDVTITLPHPLQSIRRHAIVKVDDSAGAVTIRCDFCDVNDGTVVLNSKYAAADVQSDGTRYVATLSMFSLAAAPQEVTGIGSAAAASMAAALETLGLIQNHGYFLDAVQPYTSLTGASNTTALAHAGKLFGVSHSSATNLTIPPASSVAYPLGTIMNVYQEGAGALSFVAGSGVTLRCSRTLTCRAQYSAVSCMNVATDVWLLAGDLV